MNRSHETGSRRPPAVLTSTEATGAWQPALVTVREQILSIWSPPGSAAPGGLDPATLLLAEALDVSPADTVVILNCGTGAVGVVAARLASAGWVYLATPSLLDAQAAQRAIDATGLPNASVAHRGRGESVVAKGTADLVAAVVPKGRAAINQLIYQAACALKPGGAFYLAGANDAGIQPALARVRDVFGKVAVLQYRKGARVGRAIRAENHLVLPEEMRTDVYPAGAFYRYGIDLDGVPLEVRSRPGVFSWDRLDPGTSLLFDALPPNLGSRVLDLGCGTGILGVALARRSPSSRVVLIDEDADAVASARATAAANGATNCEVLAGVGVASVEEARFDAVVANPPFHLGSTTNELVGAAFVDDAGRVLKPGGRLYVVANGFLGYERNVERVFGSVTLVRSNERYKVLLGQRQRARR